MEKVLEGMNISFDEFLDICIMSGCDYCENIKGIGPNKSYQNIKEHKTIEKFVESYKKVDTDYIEKVKTSRELFKIYDKKILEKDIKKSASLINPGELKTYLVDTCGLSERRFDNAMIKVTPK